LKRSDIVTIAVQGDYGKPRPALVIQSDNFSEHPSVTVLLITSTLLNTPLLRVEVASNPENGLSKTSQVMIDKTMTLPRAKIGQTLGSLDYGAMQQIDRCLAVFLGIAK
jgi:mRNA interferase MazF